MESRAFLKGWPTLLSLPQEIVLSISHYLDLRTTASLRGLCKSFKAMLDADITYQYRMALGVANYQNGPLSVKPTSSFERLSRLQAYQRAWESQDWTWSTTLVLEEKVIAWELLGGVVGIYKTDPDSFHFIRMPSKLRGIEEKRWTVNVEPRIIPSGGLKDTPAVKDFTLDPSQNLLVYNDTLSPDSLHVTVCSLSNGTPHPLAAEHVLEHSLDMNHPDLGVPDQEDTTYAFQIHGDYLGVLVCYDPIDGVGFNGRLLLVWNWKTAQVIRKLHGMDALESYCFLNSDYILVLKMPGNLPLLEVFPLRPGAPARALFSLPELNPASTFKAESGLIFTDTCPTYSPDSPNFPQVPFTLDSSKDRLIMICLHLVQTTDDMMVNSPLVFFVPVSTFLRFIPQSEISDVLGFPFAVSWNIWGPEGCSATTFADYSNVWICRISGMRVILSPFEEEVHGEYCIRDFCPYNYGRTKALEDQEDILPPTPLDETTQSDETSSHPKCDEALPVEPPSWACHDASVLFCPEPVAFTGTDVASVPPFSQDIITSLPYTEIVFRAKSEDTEECHYMLFEDGLVVVDRGDGNDDEDSEHSVFQICSL